VANKNKTITKEKMETLVNGESDAENLLDDDHQEKSDAKY
jgi:hypothetical protein